MEDVGEREEALGGDYVVAGLGEEVGGVGAEGGEGGREAIVGEVALDEEGDLQGRHLHLALGLVGVGGGAGVGVGVGRRARLRRRHG